VRVTVRLGLGVGGLKRSQITLPLSSNFLAANTAIQQVFLLFLEMFVGADPNQIWPNFGSF
jgi:hypothetical protein